MTIGVPYAEAHVRDDGRYYVTCPTCGEPFYGTGRGEDAVTKSASERYAAHYMADHATAPRDYTFDRENADGSVTEDVPMTCEECARPTLYDYADEAYHHAKDAATGCFLIAAEDRADDLAHPYLAEPTIALQLSELPGGPPGAVHATWSNLGGNIGGVVVTRGRTELGTITSETGDLHVDALNEPFASREWFAYASEADADDLPIGEHVTLAHAVALVTWYASKPKGE